jgi:beta-glucosidase
MHGEFLKHHPPKHRLRAVLPVAALLAAALPVAALLAAAGARAETPDGRADRLVAAMTQAEKLGLLHGPFAAEPGRPKPPGAIGSAGFVPGVKRLGIPALQETDAGLGVTDPNAIRPGDTATALPSGLAIAASFDPAAAYRNGAVLGREAAARGFNVVLGGGVDLVRDPRGGRQFEYAGEDPLLAGIMAGEAVRGTQDQHVVSTVKHFAVNDQETGRMVLSANLPDAVLRDSDLLAFEIAIGRGHPGAVMCAYNRVNTVYACENPDLLNAVLKRAWHYPGWVMSDWGAVHAVGAINAGLDQESGEQFDAQVFFGAPLAEALARGAVPQARVDDAVHRILRSMIVAGLLDHVAAPPADPAEGLAVARQGAAEGIVLLANRGLVPLPRAARRVCVIGGNADAGVAAGGGSSQVTPVGGYARQIPQGGDTQPPAFAVQVYDPPSPLSRIAAKLPGAAVVFDDGHDPGRAAALAKGCDAAVVFAQQFAGEARDVPNLALPSGQDALLQAVTAANPRTAVVLETGGAVRMPWLAQAGAVLEAWYPGSGGADAIADVLFGDVPPGGRLPVTFPAAEADLPNPALPGHGLPQGTPFTVTYPEGADVGYRWFAKRGAKPLFPFGFGLSTTRFAYANLRVTGGRTVTAAFDVTNTGPRAGIDVPQLYLTARGGVTMLRLLGWSRRVLRPGETQHVEITADPRVLGVGAVSVAVGADAEALGLRGDVEVQESEAGGTVPVPPDPPSGIGARVR